MAASAFVEQYAGLIKAGGQVLDLACGNGRHTRLLLSLGFEVTAVDLRLDGVADLKSEPRCHLLQADLEGASWPRLELQARFDGIVVVNYLHRPLFPNLLESLNPGGVIIYETFMVGNERFGKPSNPDFLLAPNELTDRFAGLQIIDFQQGEVTDPRPACRQSCCARKIQFR